MSPVYLWTAIIFVVANAAEITDEQYYEMPRLFELDDWDACMARRHAVYCLGSFDLLPHENTRLLDYIQVYSANKYHFNHTHIHRGYCVSARCDVTGNTAHARFARCVDNATRTQHGLRANLTRLEYCRKGHAPTRAVDTLDVAFACFAGIILLMNAIGTAYDYLRSEDSKPNKYLITWSLRANWARLTAEYKDGDPRLTALKPVQGMKAKTLMLIILAHTVLAYHITYIYNPGFLEKSSHHPLSAYFQNGTSIVQTFIMISNFLLAYNLLLYVDANPKRKLGLSMLPKCLMNRVTRILPAYIFVLGLAMTWWPRVHDGPLWRPLVGTECTNCRRKWWTQLLFINNLVRPDIKCLIHTWFLAVDMQLYVVSAVLTLTLGGSPRRAMKVLAGLFAAAVACNFLLAYFLELKPMVTLMFPEYMRTQFEKEASFSWLYQAPWDSLPAAILGVFMAMLLYSLQAEACNLRDKLWFRVMYRMSVPSMFLWVFLGYFMKGVTNHVGVALYAAVDRAAFSAITATAMLGFIYQIDRLWWRFMSWRGWEILGRMSLSVYLIHWLHVLMQLAMKTHPAPASVHDIAGIFTWTLCISYLSALPLHLCVEQPLQRFLQAAFS